MYLSQASKTFHMVQATSAIFRLNAGSIKYYTKNEE
jgi:hypothetical protein